MPTQEETREIEERTSAVRILVENSPNFNGNRLRESQELARRLKEAGIQRGWDRIILPPERKDVRLQTTRPQRQVESSRRR